MEADKGHLHHRIMAVGLGQRKTVLTLYSISAIMGVAGILWSGDMFVEAIVLIAVSANLIYVFLENGPKEKTGKGK